MFSEKHSAGPTTAGRNTLEFAAEKIFLKEFLADPERERHPERLQAARGERQVVLQKAIEFDEWLFVEDYIIELTLLQSSRVKAVTNRVSRKAGIVFFAGKPLFLGGGHDLTVADDRRGTVVVKSGEAKNVDWFAVV
jgi:hypothetical protein